MAAKPDLTNLKTFTAAEIAAHNTRTDLWIIIHGLVFDVTKFQAKHPGGPQSLMDCAGKDATTAFEELYHSSTAREMLNELLVGKLDTYEGPIGRAFENQSSDEASQNVGIIVALGVGLAAAVYYMYF